MERLQAPRIKQMDLFSTCANWDVYSLIRRTLGTLIFFVYGTVMGNYNL